MSGILFFTIFIILIILAIVYLYSDNKEHFGTYFYGPYGYGDTGSDPLSFYKYPIYRQPFMYPFKFYSSYPYPYMTYYETNI